MGHKTTTFDRLTNEVFPLSVASNSVQQTCSLEFYKMEISQRNSQMKQEHQRSLSRNIGWAFTEPAELSDLCYLWQLFLQQIYTILSSLKQSIGGTSAHVQVYSRAKMSRNYCSNKCFHDEVHSSQSTTTANAPYQVCNKQLKKKVTAR